MSLPTGWPGRLLALGMTCLLLAAIWLAAVAPLAGWYDDRADALAVQRERTRHMEALAALLPALRRQAAAVPPDAEHVALLEGDSDPVAGARLQERMQAIAAATGLTPSSIEMLPAAQVGAYRRIGLRLSVAADWAVLIRLLQGIQQATPRMLVDDLTLRAEHPAAPTPGQTITAELTVLAFRADARPRR
ncbi:MAG: hypothetical protein J0I21_12450 [Alphaproteobacteria bacterium]|nr:hypothetical protein [Alphaproteobacteria bacterium]